MLPLIRPRALRPKTHLPSLTTAFLQLPPSYRAFHASTSNRFITLDTILPTTHAFVEGIHSFTGLPWAAVLPLTAIVVRTCIMLPISIYVRHNTQKQWNLLPLTTAWSHEARRSTMREKRHLGPAVVARETAKAVRIKRREIYRRWGCGSWKSFLPAVSLFVWLPLMETIRSMAGARTGILGLILRKDGKDANEISQTTSTTSTTSTGVVDGFAPSIDNGLALVTDTSPYFEPTFATEGALWFQDLTVADPLLLLPFILSASMFLNLLPSRRGGLSVPGAQQSTFQRRLTNAMKVLALAAGPLTLQMPSGMLLYWISSMTVGYVQNVLLDIYMPLKRPVLPCKPNIDRPELVVKKK